MSAAPDSWYHEKESAWLYGRVAAAEPDPVRRAMFQKLGAAAEQQALRWQALEPMRSVRFSPSLRARLVAEIARRFGPRASRHALAAIKLRGLSVYTSAAPPVAPGHLMPTSVSEVGQRHRGVGGSNLRATVFGVNDGLVSNASLVMGIAGANAEPGTVLMTGVAGLLAGALSMAAGEYVSVRSQRDMYEHQIALEREELALIYEARGLELEQARAMARTLLSRPEQALDVLAREELGLNPDDLGSPLSAAVSSFLAFAVGASLTLLPFFVRGLTHPLWWTIGLTAVALAGIGLALSLFTGRGAGQGALRMLLIGGGAGVVSFLVGRLLGVALA